uniref:FHA domain-containing protein n=1 Tax=Panagrolaimus sp. ES5 TaxID=591445 RepID=A0AC34GAC0_9BILA
MFQATSNKSKYYSHGRDDGSDPETDEDEEAAEHERRKKEELEAQNPPCIRIIETHNAFRFHILTIDGGTIGCARHTTVQLPEEGAIDEEHIRIFYDHQDPASDNITKGFWLRNQSRHAILVNETVVTRKKTVEINHSDIMLIGDNRLVFHIHK